MSYDLFFRGRRSTPTLEQLRSYFAARPLWQLGEDQAIYENPATGVYFSFSLHNGDERAVPAAFNINYFRPHVFGLEAEPEVRAFVETFELDVVDPQSDGMGEGAYTSEGFLRGWNAGNAFAHRAMFSMGHAPDPLRTLPEHVHRGIWQWNRMREAYLDLLGSIEMSPCFVPTLMLLERDAEPGRLLVGAVWAEAMPVAMPEVDLIVSVNAPEAPPRLVEYATLAPLLAPYPLRPASYAFRLDGLQWVTGLAHHVIDYPDGPPRALVEALRRGGSVEQVSRVGFDGILDGELCARERGG